MNKKNGGAGWPARLLALCLLLAATACTTPNNRVTSPGATTPAGVINVDVSKLWRMAPRVGSVASAQGILQLAGDGDPRLPVTPGSFTILVDATPLLDQDESLRNFSWTLDGREVATTRTAQLSVSTLGVHQLGLRVSDNAGRSASDLKTIAVADRLIVVMGDSVAAGEGNPDKSSNDGSHFTWQNERCHRSGHAYGERAAEKLQADNPQVSVTLVSVACSGASTGESGASPVYCTAGWLSGSCFSATTAGGILRPYMGQVPPANSQPLPTQIDQIANLVGNRPIDDLIITVGGNDINFHGVALDCASLATECNQDTVITRDLAMNLDMLGRVGGGYDQVAAAINNKLHVRRVWITTYFDPTTDKNGNTCPDDTILNDAGRYMPQMGNSDPIKIAGGRVSSAEASWVSRVLLMGLNDKIMAAAARNGWNVIGSPAAGGTFAQQFVGHGYCAPTPWVMLASQSAMMQGPGIWGSGTEDTSGTLHPNFAGITQYANLVENRLSTGGPKLTLSNGMALGGDCAGSDGWLSGSRTLGAAGCAPGIWFTVSASNPTRAGQPSETDGVYLTGLRAATQGPQLLFDGQRITFDTSNSQKWTCSGASGLSCEVDVSSNAGGADFIFTLQTQGSHTFDLKVGNGLGVDSELVWTAKADWTPPATTAALAGSTTTAVLHASDALSGVAAMYYQLNGGPQQQATATGIPLRSGDTLVYWSTDVAGNIEAPHTARLVNAALVIQS